MAELGAWLESQVDVLAASLNRAVREALLVYERLKTAGGKGQLSHIYVSFLRSGVLCKTPLLRLDLLDENCLNDTAECGVAWDVPNISNRIYREADARAKQRERVKDYDLERMWLDAAEEYDRALGQILPKVIERCSAVPVECQWHFRATPMGNRDGKGKHYFRLGQDTRIPYGVVLRHLNRINGYSESKQGNLMALERAFASPVYTSSENFYPDILDRQIFMIKASVKDTFDLFMPKLEYKYCKFLDNPLEKYTKYYIPMLDVIDLYAGISRANTYVFRIANTKEIEVAATLEVVEAILRRDPTGIRIKAID